MTTSKDESGRRAAEIIELNTIGGTDTAPVVLADGLLADIADAIASRQAVVKRLEWWEPLQSNNQTIGARSLVGTYYIHVEGGRHQAWIETFPDAKIEQWEGPERGSLEQAQEDAQADYTQRIRSALE